MFLVSGGAYFYMINGRIFVTLFVISTIFYVLKYRKVRNSGNKRNPSAYFLILFLFWFFLEYFVINTNHTGDIQPFIYIAFSICSYFVISSFTLEKFRKVYLNICSRLVFIGLLIYLLVMVGLLHPTAVHKGGNVQQICLFHSFGWGSVTDRFMSIYWEPGACQIVLITTFFLFFDGIVNLKIKKEYWWKFAIILLAVFLTQSTAAYINIAVLGVITILKSSFRKRNVILALFFLVIGALIVWGLSTSAVITDKFAQEGEKGSSYEIRKADNLAMIQMTYERPILGYGMDTKDFNRRSYLLDNVTGSNGILSLTSRLGIPFLLFYIFSIFINQRRNNTLFNSMVLTFLYILLNSTEVYWYFPIAYLSVIAFKNNKKEVASSIKASL